MRTHVITRPYPATPHPPGVLTPTTADGEHIVRTPPRSEARFRLHRDIPAAGVRPRGPGNSPPLHPCAPRDRGFTLIELLIVIAIIIMLSAMLLPALVGARERANDAKCISNMRQIGVAMKMYQDDNETRFPLASLPVTGEGGQVVYREFRF